MTLKDLKPSLTDLSQAEALDLIAETRRKRLSPTDKPLEKVSFYKTLSNLNKEELLELKALLDERR